jgi:hypothetical protein
MTLRVPLREGYPFAMTFRFTAGIDAKYTTGKFVLRERPTADSRVILECDESNGLSIDHGTGIVAISLDGTKTDTVDIDERTLQCWGEVRLADPDHPGDRVGGQFPVAIIPSLFASP